jgi:hypothetical protein
MHESGLLGPALRLPASVLPALLLPFSVVAAQAQQVFSFAGLLFTAALTANPARKAPTLTGKLMQSAI